MEHLEGRQSVLAALKAGHRRFQSILISYGAHVEKLQDVLDLAAQRGVPVRRGDPRELDALAHGATHGGIVAVCSPKPLMTPDQLVELLGRLGEPPLLLLLEGVVDARNLGFTLRRAEALGVHAILIKKHLWDLDSVEVARPSSGAYERMPLVKIEDVSPLTRLQREGLRLYGCIAGAKRRMYDVDLAGPSILAIGGEKRGLSGAVRAICDRFITVPTSPGRPDVSSLSLSHASALVMGEAMRQRLPRRGTTAPAGGGEAEMNAAEDVESPVEEG